jgi:4-amino-4-deoxy-L-arabinose transferase-like glycosyltransferase
MKKIEPYIKYIVLAVLIYMPVFGHLDALPIRIWDEARLAINAYEMFKDGNFIVTHFGGNPDMWNTKPPLLIWFQVFFMKILGVNELAVRLPSAIAAFFTCIALLVFSHRYLKNFWFGFIAVLVLITTHGYINLHASRTGDYDALLTLFTTLSGLLFFSYCEKQNNKHLYLFFLFMALGVLTKSVTGLLFSPALFIYSIIQKQLIPLLKNKHFYIGLFSFLGLIIGYYLLREANNPGYIAAVAKNELGGRYLEVIENHQRSFWFYYKNFIDFQLSVWYLFIPCGLITGIVVKNKKINRITWFAFLMSITFFLVISTAQTKIGWYDVPLYPFLAILIAVFIYYIFDLLQKFKPINNTLTKNVTPFIFLFFIGITPYQKILDKTYRSKEYNWNKGFYDIGYFLKGAIKGKYDLNKQYLLYDGYNAQNLFYLNILNDMGTQISFKDWRKLSPMDITIACQNHVKKYVEEHYEYVVKHTEGNIKTYTIYGRKK